MASFFHRFKGPDERFTVVFDDDGRVAYASLLDSGTICSDVWVYNVGDCPEEPEWRDKSKMPFRNPCAFTRPRDFQRPTTSRQVSFCWKRSGDGGTLAVTVFLNDCPVARLAPGSKPGWARLALKDGPLARVLHDPDAADGGTPGRP
jgi:hypothetical protein